MASATPPEKDLLADAYATRSSIRSKSSYFSPISPFADAYDRFAQWRADLGLPHPGTVEILQKEVKCTCTCQVCVDNLNICPAFVATHLSNYIFDGARADLTKSLSANPLFQVTHSFALGSQTLPSSYNFGAIFANQKVLSAPCRVD